MVSKVIIHGLDLHSHPSVFIMHLFNGPLTATKTLIVQYWCFGALEGRRDDTYVLFGKEIRRGSARLAK
jgi:hypothetical protein